MRSQRPNVEVSRLLVMLVDNCPYLYLAQTYSHHALGLKLGFKLRQLGVI